MCYHSNSQNPHKMGTLKTLVCKFFFTYIAYKSLESRDNDKGVFDCLSFPWKLGRRQQVVGIIVVANRLFIAPRDDTRHNKYSR